MWPANYAALRTTQPALAEHLATVSLPPDWRPVLGLDGFPTWRLEPAGADPLWLGGTAAPRTRAAGVLQGLVHRGKNVALPCLAAGGELLHLLRTLPEHLAIFVFAEDDRTVAATLRSSNFASDIAAGRCYFVLPDAAEDALRDLLTTLPGLLPPGEIVAPSLVAPERIADLQALGVRINQWTAAHRAHAAESLTPLPLREGLGEGSAPAPPRLALLSLLPSPHARVLSALAHHAESLGWNFAAAIVTDPRTVDVACHVPAVHSLAPTATLCVNHGPELFPRRLPGHAFTWHTGVPAPHLDLSGSAQNHLAASPRIAAALRNAGVEDPRITPWYWACDPAWTIGPSPAPQDVVLFLGNLPPADAASYGLSNPAHQRLWEEVARLIQQRWQTPRLLPAGGLLADAERASGCRLEDEAARHLLLHLIEERLIPAVLLETITRACVRGGLRIATVGHGWERIEGDNPPIAPHAAALADRGDFAPRACVAAGYLDPLSPELLLAAARGWPLLVQQFGAAPIAGALGDVLAPDAHFTRFATLAEFQPGLQSAWDGSPQVRQRADRARAHVAAKHSFTQRLATLARLVLATSA